MSHANLSLEPGKLPITMIIVKVSGPDPGRPARPSSRPARALKIQKLHPWLHGFRECALFVSAMDGGSWGKLWTWLITGNLVRCCCRVRDLHFPNTQREPARTACYPLDCTKSEVVRMIPLSGERNLCCCSRTRTAPVEPYYRQYRDVAPSDPTARAPAQHCPFCSICGVILISRVQRWEIAAASQSCILLELLEYQADSSTSRLLVNNTSKPPVWGAAGWFLHKRERAFILYTGRRIQTETCRHLSAIARIIIIVLLCCFHSLSLLVPWARGVVVRGSFDMGSHTYDMSLDLAFWDSLGIHLRIAIKPAVAHRIWRNSSSLSRRILAVSSYTNHMSTWYTVSQGGSNE